MTLPRDGALAVVSRQRMAVFPRQGAGEMAKITRSADADESTIDIALKKQVPSREFEGTDDQPVDADTGESLFEDISPRIRAWGPKDKSKQKPVDEDEGLDEEIDEELEQDGDEPAEEADDELDQDESTDAEEADEEEELPREKKNSKAWSKRLEREKRLREEAEANFADAMTRIIAVEQTQKLNASEGEYNSAKATLESQIAETRTKLTSAMDNGSAQDQLALTEELTELKSELRSKKDKFEAAKAAVSAKKDAGPSPIVARRVSAWMRKHPRYRTDKVFQDLAARAREFMRRFLHFKFLICLMYARSVLILALASSRSSFVFLWRSFNFIIFTFSNGTSCSFQ